METLTNCERFAGRSKIQNLSWLKTNTKINQCEIYQENVGKSEKQKKTLKTPFES